MRNNSRRISTERLIQVDQSELLLAKLVCELPISTHLCLSFDLSQVHTWIKCAIYTIKIIEVKIPHNFA